jgi:hypothetical protein
MNYGLSWDFENEVDSSTKQLRMRITLRSNHPGFPIIKKFPFVETEEHFQRQIKFVEARIKAYQIGLRVYPWAKEKYTTAGTFGLKGKKGTPFRKVLGHKYQSRKYPARDKLQAE